MELGHMFIVASLYAAHRASHGNLEQDLENSSLRASGWGPDRGSAACPEDGKEKAEEDGEEEVQLKKHECRAWAAEKA